MAPRRTPAERLYDALCVGNLAAAKAAKQAGAGVNHSDPSLGDGKTPMNVACQFGHLELATWLHAAGAAVDCKDRSGWTPLYLACFYGHLQTVKWLVGAGAAVEHKDDPLTPLRAACSHGHLEIAQWLHAQGATLEVTDKSGWAPMHHGAPPTPPAPN
jgi:ankyrin repeat protein